MANNYSEATGVLVLDKVTPVIKACFNQFGVEGDYPGNGTAYIAQPAESYVTWDTVTEDLKDLCISLGIGVDEADRTEDILGALADHFNMSGDADLLNMIEHDGFKEEATLDEMFFLATKFDDGHGLSAMKMEGCWYCDKLRLGEQGGWGQYTGKHFSHVITSGEAADIGERIDKLLGENNMQAAAKLIEDYVKDILKNIVNDDHRRAIRKNLLQILASHQN